LFGSCLRLSLARYFFSGGGGGSRLLPICLVLSFPGFAPARRRNCRPLRWKTQQSWKLCPRFLSIKVASDPEDLHMPNRSFVTSDVAVLWPMPEFLKGLGGPRPSPQPRRSLPPNTPLPTDGEGRGRRKLHPSFLPAAGWSRCAPATEKGGFFFGGHWGPPPGGG